MRRVFLFNPTSEMAVANNTVSYVPPAFLRKFEKDVSPLMGFVGEGADFLVTENRNNGAFREFWRKAGFELPEFTSLENIPYRIEEDKLFPVPWGWNKTVHRLLSPLRPFFDSSFVSSPDFDWKEGYRDTFSRETSVRFMQDVKEETKGHEFISVPYTPVVVSTLKEIEEWNKKGKLPYVFKTPWSSSGRGLYPITEKQFVERSNIWVKSRLRQQKKLIIEPWLNKLQDVSFLFYIHAGGDVEYLGVNFFETGRVGEFKKEYIGMPEELMMRLDSISLPVRWTEEVASVLSDVLVKKNFHEFYCGPIGVDGLIYADERGGIKVHPCIEINFRLNMGYVNLKLKDILHPEAKGEWTIKQFPEGEWKKFAEERMKAHAVELAGGRIVKGFVPLVPVTDEQLYGVWAEV